MITISSIYLAMASGWMGCVSRKDLMIVERKILAIVGENAAPIAVPEKCGYQS